MYSSFQDFFKYLKQTGMHGLYLRYSLPLADGIGVGRAGVVPATDGLSKLHSTLDDLLKGIKKNPDKTKASGVNLNNNDIGLYFVVDGNDAEFQKALKDLFLAAGYPYYIKGRPRSMGVLNVAMLELGRIPDWDSITKRPGLLGNVFKSVFGYESLERVVLN